MDFYWLILGGLATWRITHLLFAEDGPWKVLVRLRWAAGTSVFGSLLDCFLCLSVWVAVLPAYVIGVGWTERLLLWPGLSAIAILIERTFYRDEREESSDVMLWTGPSPTPPDPAAAGVNSRQAVGS